MTLKPEQKLVLLESLKFLVQYRNKNSGYGWRSMVAYDVDSMAIKYCDECNERPRPWVYRVINLDTGEVIHEPKPKQEAEP